MLSRRIRLDAGETKNDEGREVAMTNTVRELLIQCVQVRNQRSACLPERMVGLYEISEEPGKRFAVRLESENCLVANARGQWMQINIAQIAALIGLARS